MGDVMAEEVAPSLRRAYVRTCVRALQVECLQRAHWFFAAACRCCTCMDAS